METPSMHFTTPRELLRAGAQGICIEDNSYPRCNSFFEKKGKQLASIEDMQAKISAIKTATREDLLVIARNEGLIFGLPLEEVLLRTQAYFKAGADIAVIHTTQWNPLKEYLDSCEQNKPLAVIPTKIPEVSQKELQKHFKIIIYANQLLRASITAAEDIMKKIRQEGLSAQSESTIASLKSVFSYNDMDEMTELEKHFYKPVN